MTITATELKNNLGKYLILAATEDIFITKNGYSDLVVMSSELYDKFARMNRIDEPRKIVYVVTIQYQGRNL